MWSAEAEASEYRVLALQLPATIRLAAGRTVGLVLFFADCDCLLVFPAILPAFGLVSAGRRDRA